MVLEEALPESTVLLDEHGVPLLDETGAKIPDPDYYGGRWLEDANGSSCLAIRPNALHILERVMNYRQKAIHCTKR